MTLSERTELVKYRMNRAKETFSDVEFQVENRKWSTAVNRLYYACYYAVTALLLWNELNTKTHNGVRQMFALHFIKTNIIDRKHADIYTDIFDMRQTGDYGDFIIIDENKIIALLQPARELIGIIEKNLPK